MTSRRPVPAALRDELTEYSNLLRALRTSRTLDVTAHLAQAHDPSNDESHGSGLVVATAPTTIGDDNMLVETGVGTKRKRSSSQPTPRHWRKRDQWTRWPLLAQDVPQPEWSLRDEVGAIIKQILTSSGDSDSDAEMTAEHEEDVESDGSSTESADEEAYMLDLAELVTPVVENHLESLFALISAHTIARSHAMQNRIEPFDWRDLVNILGSPAALHLVDEKMLQDLIARMQVICGTTPASASTSIPPPSFDSALHRHSLAKRSRSRLNQLLSSHTASLFEQTSPPPGYRYLTLHKINLKKERAKKKARRKRRVKVQESDDGPDESSEAEERQEPHAEVGTLDPRMDEDDSGSEWNTQSETESD